MKKVLTTLTALMLLAATLAGPAGASEGDDGPGSTTTTIGHDSETGPTTTVVDNPDDDHGDEADQPDDNGSTTTTIVVRPRDDEPERPDGEHVGEDSDGRTRAERPGRTEERRRRREEKLRREQERRDRRAEDSTDESADRPEDSTDRPDVSTDGRDGDRPDSRRADVRKRLLRACREDVAAEGTDAASSEACRIIRDALSNADDGGQDGEGDLTREEIRNRIVDACREATADDGSNASSSDQVADDAGSGNDFSRCVRTLKRADARERIVQACRSAVGAENAGVNIDLAERCRRVAEHRPDLTELPDGTKEVCQTALLGGSSRAEELCLRDIAENLDTGTDA